MGLRPRQTCSRMWPHSRKDCGNWDGSKARVFASTCTGTQATPYLQRPTRRSSSGKGPSGAPWRFRAYRSGRSPEGSRGDLFLLVVLGLNLLLLLDYWSHLVSGRGGAGILARQGPYSDRRREACRFRICDFLWQQCGARAGASNSLKIWSRANVTCSGGAGPVCASISSKIPPSCSAVSREGRAAVDVVADIMMEPKVESDELWVKDAIIY